MGNPEGLQESEVGVIHAAASQASVGPQHPNVPYGVLDMKKALLMGMLLLGTT